MHVASQPGALVAHQDVTSGALTGAGVGLYCCCYCYSCYRCVAVVVDYLHHNAAKHHQSSDFLDNGLVL